MHTSKLLQASDFGYRRRGATGWSNVDLTAVCPDYHPQDRVGVVSLYLEDGIRHAGAALLALVTAFYDALRARGGEFYDYPQHFALLAVEEGQVRTREGPWPFDATTVARPWGHLDVWPESNWIASGGSAAAMLRKLCDLHLQRVFWPAGLRHSGNEPPLPDSLRRMLLTRLKTAYFYGAADADAEIRVTPAAEQLLRNSLARLPRLAGAAEEVPPVDPPTDGTPFTYAEQYHQVTADEFLATVCGEPR